jgi:type IV pilus assembly protein PilB
MIEAPPRTRWLFDVALAEHVVSSDEIPTVTTDALPDAWREVARLAAMTQAQLAERVAAHFHLAVADLTEVQPDAITLVPERLARTRLVMPIRQTNHDLTIATADPTDVETQQLVEFASGRPVVLEIASPADIIETQDARYAPDSAVERLLSRVGAEMGTSAHVVVQTEPDAVIMRQAATAPIIALTNLIIGDAVHARASDIHLEPAGEGGRIRFRVDGILQLYARVPMPVLNRVVSCIKIMGQMDIADRMRPQDGRARVRVEEHDIDLRLSTVPTRDAEKAVIRLLDPRNAKHLEDLSLSTEDLLPFRTLLEHRDGIVLVTGPTGSGKTTLLYAALREMPAGELNIMTVEDPVEYQLPGLTQMQVESKRDVTFAKALRSILRQDPDVIFIGEIRDAETASIAVQASLTGHLVLASLHTNDAVGAVDRFADLGIPRREIASTLRGATAQRLVRRVCPKCAVKISGSLTPDESRLAVRYGVTPTVRATGCPHCAQTGYYGRIPLLEIMVVSPALESQIVEGATTSALQHTAIADGMRPLRDAAALRVRAGETTIEEIDRELGEADAEAPTSSSSVPSALATHILVVDDDAVTRAVARSILESNGFRVSEAADGADALDLVSAQKDVALVVLDLAMPKMTGHEVLKRLRGSVSTISLPVIVLTGVAEDHTEVELLSAGADDYVRKPLDPDRFVVRIKAALRRSQR